MKPSSREQVREALQAVEDLPRHEFDEEALQVHDHLRDVLQALLSEEEPRQPAGVRDALAWYERIARGPEAGWWALKEDGGRRAREALGLASEEEGEPDPNDPKTWPEWMRRAADSSKVFAAPHPSVDEPKRRFPFDPKDPTTWTPEEALRFNETPGLRDAEPEPAVGDEPECEAESPLRWEHGRWLCSRCERSFGPGLRWHGCGDRTIDHPAQCGICQGSGTIQQGPVDGRCASCEGTGWRKPRSAEPDPCPECEGGTTVPVVRAKEGHDRHGEFIAPNIVDEPCPACTGSEPTPKGLIQVPPLMEEMAQPVSDLADACKLHDARLAAVVIDEEHHRRLRGPRPHYEDCVFLVGVPVRSDAHAGSEPQGEGDLEDRDAQWLECSATWGPYEVGARERLRQIAARLRRGASSDLESIARRVESWIDPNASIAIEGIAHDQLEDLAACIRDARRAPAQQGEAPDYARPEAVQDAREWIDALNEVKAERDSLKAELAIEREHLTCLREDCDELRRELDPSNDDLTNLEAVKLLKAELEEARAELASLRSAPRPEAEAIAKEIEEGSENLEWDARHVTRETLAEWAARVRRLAAPPVSEQDLETLEGAAAICSAVDSFRAEQLRSLANRLGAQEGRE